MNRRNERIHKAMLFLEDWKIARLDAVRSDTGQGVRWTVSYFGAATDSTFSTREIEAFLEGVSAVMRTNLFSFLDN